MSINFTLYGNKVWSEVRPGVTLGYDDYYQIPIDLNSELYRAFEERTTALAKWMPLLREFAEVVKILQNG